MHRLEEEQAHRFLHVRDALTSQALGERAPRPRVVGHDLAPVEKDVASVGLELEAQSLLRKDAGAVKVLETRDGIATEEERPGTTRKAERLTEGLLDHAPAATPDLLCVRA